MFRNKGKRLRIQKLLNLFVYSLLLLGTSVSFSALSKVPSITSEGSSSKKRLHILLLNSGNQALPMEQEILKGLKNKLKGNTLAVDIYQEYLDTARFNEQSQNFIVANYLENKYLSTPIDIVISNGIPAANFLTNHLYLFKDIQQVYVRSGKVDISSIKNKIVIDASNNYKKSVKIKLNTNSFKII